MPSRATSARESSRIGSAGVDIFRMGPPSSSGFSVSLQIVEAGVYFDG
jgi:hypothetical protein